MKYLINLLLMFCTSCYAFDEASRKDRLCNEVVDRYAAQLLKKRNMQIVASGGGADEGKCTLLALGFNIKGRLDVKRARKAIVPSVLELLEMLNSSEHAKEFLIEVPFTAAKLDYAISSVDKNGAKIRFDTINDRGDEISHVLLTGDKIYYAKFPSEYKPAWTIHEETFDEAIAILKEEGYDPYPKKCAK